MATIFPQSKWYYETSQTPRYTQFRDLSRDAGVQRDFQIIATATATPAQLSLAPENFILTPQTLTIDMSPTAMMRQWEKTKKAESAKSEAEKLGGAERAEE